MGAMVLPAIGKLLELRESDLRLSGPSIGQAQPLSRVRAARARTAGFRSVGLTGGGAGARPVNRCTASFAERTEYSTVNTVSRGISQNWPMTAEFTAPSGTTGGRSPAALGINW